MKIGKKNIKWIILVVIALIILSTVNVCVYADYLATQVNYTRNNSTTTVSAALNDLYDKAVNYKKLDTVTTATAGDIVSGKTAYNSAGQLLTGSYSYTPTYGTITDSSYQGTIPATAYTSSINLNKGKYLFIITTAQGWGRSDTLSTSAETYSAQDFADYPSALPTVTYTNSCNLELMSARFSQTGATRALGSNYQALNYREFFYSLDVLSNNSTITAAKPTDSEQTNQCCILNISAIPIS